jgi:hypothetical protein
MSKHIKASRVREPRPANVENFLRRKRRKALRAKIKARTDYMAGWAERPANPPRAQVQ